MLAVVAAGFACKVKMTPKETLDSRFSSADCVGNFQPGFAVIVQAEFINTVDSKNDLVPP
jgi:hypothetical protein